MALARLAELLKSQQLRIVFAESCTAGLVSAKLATVAGISAYHCGSQATYREQSKIDWLGVREDTLAKFTAVSEEVTREMAAGVLQRTPEAHYAVAVTGHLGPNAPDSLDGAIFIATLRRDVGRATCIRQLLTTTERGARLDESAAAVIDEAVRRLEQ